MPNNQMPYQFDDRVTADARERFLSNSARSDDRVRQMILSSWQRSQENDVVVDRLRVPFVRQPDFHTPLCRSAAPIFDALAEHLNGEPMNIILTDHRGLVLDRRCPDHGLTLRLDEVRLAPGFSYAEEHAGTNGIGTSLSSGQATLVIGREHYAEELGQFACAGVPIHHPTRGNIVGLVDLTTWSTAPGAILSALASATARQIELELLAQSGIREQILLAEYVNVSRRSKGPVLALNNDVIMTNSPLRRLLDGPEQESLIAHALDTMAAVTHEVARTVELTSGRSVRLRYAPVLCDSGRAGGVFRVQLGHSPETAGPGLVVRAAPRALAGLAGRGSVWARCIRQIDASYQSRDWVMVEGEPGVGKRAVLRAVHRRHDPGGSFRVLDAPDSGDLESWFATWSDSLSDPHCLIVLAKCEQLNDQLAEEFADLLTDAFASIDDQHRARIAVTITAGATTSLRSIFPRTVEVPALRHHIDDLPELVSHLLTQLTKDERLSFSPAALNQLVRLPWPGNVAQLRRVLVSITRTQRSGIVELANLPPECRSSSNKRLSPIEALERDAIVMALYDDGATPTSAAEVLGMSRATMYRRIRQYGIVLPPAP